MIIRARTTFAAIATLVCATASCTPVDNADTDASAATPDIPGLSGAALPMGSPAAAGVSEEGLARIVPAMQAHVDAGHVPGIVTMVARGGEIVHWEAVGKRDVESGDPLEPDDIFRIYSMTKPMTSTAIMMLVERGDVALEDPVSKFIPAFANMSVLEEDGSRTPVDPPMTVKHLLSHNSGLTYGLFGNSPADQAYQASGLFQAESLEQFIDTVAGLPLLAQPGDVWNYSVSTDVLGYIVQVASGQAFEDFLHDNIIEPLGMDDTAFWVQPEDRDRFTTHYAASPEGLQIVDSPTDGDYSAFPAMASGGGGLVSTASDYIRFAQMLLQGGQLDDIRILQPETVLQMRTNQLPEGLTPISLAGWIPPAYGFGLGFATLIDEDVTSDADHDGVFRWGGIANTFFWIDPEAELIAMVWTQMDPFLVYGLESEFQTLVYEALEGSAE